MLTMEVAMIKISVIKKYLFIGLLFLGLGTTQQAHTNGITDWFNNPLNLPAVMPTEIVDAHHIGYMLFIGFFGAITAGVGLGTVVKGIEELFPEKKDLEKDEHDQKAQEDEDAPYTKKVLSTHKIPKYTLAGVGLIIFGLTCIVGSNQLARILDSLVNKPKPTTLVPQK